MVLRIGVVGAGNVGLSAAYHLQKSFPQSQIYIVAEHFLEQTTSYGAGGVWEPYTVGDTPLDLIEKWGRASYDHYLRMAASEVGHECGVQILNVFQLLSEQEPMEPTPWWSSIPIGFRPLTSTDTSRLGFAKYSEGYTYTTVVIDQKYHMRFLTRELKKLGVTFIQRRIDSFSDLDYDIIVNCSGLGARDLCQDGDMHPARGQVLRVHAPWIKEAWFLGPDYYLIPNIDTLVIGGTLGKNNWSTTIAEADTDLIMKNVCQSFPSLAEAKVVICLYHRQNNIMENRNRHG